MFTANPSLTTPLYFKRRYLYRKEKESGLKRFKMNWIIETEFDYNKNMWRSTLRYGGSLNKDGSIKYCRVCSSLHPDKQPCDDVIEYFEEKKKKFAEFLINLKQLANAPNTHNQE